MRSCKKKHRIALVRFLQQGTFGQVRGVNMWNSIIVYIRLVLAWEG